MKICVLTHTFPRNKKDATAAFMKGFCDGLVEAGNQVVVVTPFTPQISRKGDPFKIATYRYIWPEKLHLLGYSMTMEADVALRKRAYFLLPFLLVFGTLALLRVVKSEKPDLVNVHWVLPNGIMALIVFWLTKVPFVVTIPGTDAYLAYKNKIFGWISKLVAQNSIGITSNSALNLNRILKLDVGDRPTTMLAYPADISMFKPITSGVEEYRKKHGLGKGNFIILAVGRLVYKKGFDYLIKAVSSVVKKHPEVRLIIGGDGDLRGEWEQLAKKLQIQDKVLFVGNINRDEIIYYYNLSDVFVAPSIIDRTGNVDGGPVVSLESMACGKPQILTNVLGMADVVKEGVNGYVIPQKDEDALASAIQKLVGSPRLRRSMGRANRILVTSELTTEKIGRKYTEFFKHALEVSTN